MKLMEKIYIRLVPTIESKEKYEEIQSKILG